MESNTKEHLLIAPAMTTRSTDIQQHSTTNAKQQGQRNYHDRDKQQKGKAFRKKAQGNSCPISDNPVLAESRSQNRPLQFGVWWTNGGQSRKSVSMAARCQVLKAIDGMKVALKKESCLWFEVSALLERILILILILIPKLILIIILILILRQAGG